MKALKRILLGIVAVVILLIVVSFFLPSEYKVERSTIIKAPVEKVYMEFYDLNNWPSWNAFDDDFPDIKYTTSNPGSGTGAVQSWKSEKMNGAMEITETIPNQLVNIKLTFEGFGDPLYGEIKFNAVHEGTKVTWTDRGKTGNNPIYKYMCLMMDNMMGNTMEKCFENLKKICEQ